MAAIANNPAFAKKAGIPQSVGSDFVKADKGHKFRAGGNVASEKSRGTGIARKGKAPTEELTSFGAKASNKGMKGGGAIRGGGVESKGKTQGKWIKH